jgi:hypothetical protein
MSSKPVLRSTDEHHPLLGRERRQMLVHDVVFALTPNELDHRHSMVAGVAADPRGERVADLPQRRGRRDRQPQLPVHEPHQPGRVLQLRHEHVEIHPIDALDLEHHMIVEDIGHTARYRHHGLRSDGGLTGQPNRYKRFHTPDRHAGHGLHPADRSPPTQTNHGMPRRAGATPR